jgi:hypothetical protein
MIAVFGVHAVCRSIDRPLETKTQNHRRTPPAKKKSGLLSSNSGIGNRGGTNLRWGNKRGRGHPSRLRNGTSSTTPLSKEYQDDGEPVKIILGTPQ